MRLLGSVCPNEPPDQKNPNPSVLRDLLWIEAQNVSIYAIKRQLEIKVLCKSGTVLFILMPKINKISDLCINGRRERRTPRDVSEKFLGPMRDSLRRKSRPRGAAFSF